MADSSTAAGPRIGKSRRPRWTPSEDAKALLETIFSAYSFPTFTVRNQLAEQLGIDSRQVQIWFQNRRQRERSKLISGAAKGETGEDDEAQEDVQMSELPAALALASAGPERHRPRRRPSAQPRRRRRLALCSRRRPRARSRLRAPTDRAAPPLRSSPPSARKAARPTLSPTAHPSERSMPLARAQENL